MKKIVIDINILMDFLFKREGHEKAAEILGLCLKGMVKGYVCAHEITTLSYFLNKTIKNKQKIKKSTSFFINKFEVIEINAEILGKALTSEINDFEDAVIEASSIEKKVEYILTSNIKDFKKSVVNAITPDELLVLIKQH